MTALDALGDVCTLRWTALDEFPDLVVRMSTRQGGVSEPPYDTLNLGRSTEDDPAAVAENRRRFFRAIDIPEDRVVVQHQVHGVDVRSVDCGGYCGDVDATMTAEPNVFLTVTVADCVPILVFDPVSKSCGAAHAGWRGSAAGIAGRLIQEMQRRLRVDPRNLVAVVGPSIGPDAYEVGPEVASHFDPSCVSRLDGRVYLNLWQANHRQLSDASVQHILVTGQCTATQSDLYFSHRRSGGRTGRMLAVIGFRS